MVLTVTDGELDLSMSQLEEVPMKDVVAVKNKVRKLDLSNNQLQLLPMDFAPSLTLLVELDLSKNQLSMIPDNIGLLVNLQHLDLYSNNIERLPLSFKELKKLRWLDLKDNPLTPQLAKIAGPCVDKEDCKRCARDIVIIMQEIYKNIEEDKVSGQDTKPAEPVSGPNKDKKKKKKGNKNPDAKTKKESPAKSQQPQWKELELEDKTGGADADIVSSQDLSTPRRGYLCQSLIRGFFWSMFLVFAFIACLFLSRRPEVQPYVRTMNQKLQLFQVEFERYSEVYLSKLLVYVAKFREIWAANLTRFNSFVDGTLVIYLEDFKVRFLDGFAEMKVQINEYLTKKD
ncbi:leucine-rich repeat-containing protein 59-like [Cloeon dipterum]|uniref:leucine-rich repeat-containing protein 59-like n=1 Tax=Cloeon dipterum TaxID=197152 RepID=UPI00321F88FB